jgi:hypothetical protein
VAGFGGRQRAACIHRKQSAKVKAWPATEKLLKLIFSK